MPANSKDSWEGLNNRQQVYLRSIYDVDQETEKLMKEGAAVSKWSVPADEWRWLKYGYDPYENKMPLLERITALKLADRGTGSTFQALASRQLILVRHEKSPFGEDIPFVRMTAKGRKMVRTATGEVRPKKTSVGTLREWHWRALARAYRAALEEKEGLDDENWGMGYYGGLSWNTWLRLRDYKLNGEYMQLVKEHEKREPKDSLDRYVIRITSAGQHYYEAEWERYRNLYPDVESPKPMVSK